MPSGERTTLPSKFHGFLAYLRKMRLRDAVPYTIIGYKGKQVRDNIHSHDLITAFDAFYQNPKKEKYITLVVHAIPISL